MRDDEYQLNFPAGVAIPAPLCALLQFQNASTEWYSGFFELSKWAFGNPAWFGDDRQAAEQFVVIGSGPDGSLYALWTRSAEKIEDAPVVFLGSEGTDNGVLARSLRDFMALLAIGAEELGFAASWGDVAEAESPAPRLDAFRRWLDETFGIVAPAAPDQVIAAARVAHADFEAWLAAWFAARA